MAESSQHFHEAGIEFSPAESFENSMVSLPAENTESGIEVPTGAGVRIQR
jgi:hypothetical protein